MAIYHLDAKVISRGIGRSACAAAAYMSCSAIFNDYDGIQHDYTRKRGLVWERVFLPEYAPASWSDRSVLWNAVEKNETTKNSRLAREMVVALPIELKPEEQKKLLTEYINKNFVSDGMCADVSIHDTEGHNPHAHILLTVRPLEQDGTWQYKTEKEYLCIRDGEERGFTAAEWKTAQTEGWEKQYPYKPEKGKKNIYLPLSEAEKRGLVRANKYPKSTKYGRQNPVSERWNSEEQLVKWRSSWADMTNQYLEQANVPERIDHRSNAERGLEEKPTIHEGVFARMMEKEGKISIRCEINRQIREDNRIIREMKAVITALSKKIQYSIPAIAAKLESLRDSLIVCHYQISFNKMQLAGIKEFCKTQKPLLDEMKKIRQSIRKKTIDRKQLKAEQKECSALNVMKRLSLSRQITTLTEDIEELKSRKVQLMEMLECDNETEVKNLETKTVKMEQVKPKIENQQKTLREQRDTTAIQYSETLASVAEEDLREVQQERRNTRYGGRTELIRKLRDIYGDRFNRRQFDVTEKEVDEGLAVREISRKQKSIHERLQEQKRELSSKTQTKHKQDLSL